MLAVLQCPKAEDGDGSGVFAEGGIYAYNNVIANNTDPVGCRQVANSNKGGNFWFEYNAIQDLDDIDWTAASGSAINQNNINLTGNEDLLIASRIMFQPLTHCL